VRQASADGKCGPEAPRLPLSAVEDCHLQTPGAHRLGYYSFLACLAKRWSPTRVMVKTPEAPRLPLSAVEDLSVSPEADEDLVDRLGARLRMRYERNTSRTANIRNHRPSAGETPMFQVVYLPRKAER
jgi:hypothetical protein